MLYESCLFLKYIFFKTMLDIIFSVPDWKKLQKFDNAELTNCEERLTLIHCY